MNPESTTTDPVAQWGRELGEVTRELTAVDEGSAEHPQGSMERRRLETREGVLHHRQNALEGMICTTKAESAEGAIAQLIVAHAQIELVASGNFDDFQVKMARRDIEAVLYSAVAILTNLSGIDRDDMGARFYMPGRCDPYRTDAESPPSNLAELEAELLARWTAPEAEGISDEELDADLNPISALEARISEAPVETLDDLAVKLRRLHTLIGPDGDSASIWDRAYWRTILDGIERLSGGAS